MAGLNCGGFFSPCRAYDLYLKIRCVSPKARTKGNL